MSATLQMKGRKGSIREGSSVLIWNMTPAIPRSRHQRVTSASLPGASRMSPSVIMKHRCSGAP